MNGVWLLYSRSWGWLMWVVFALYVLLYVAILLSFVVQSLLWRRHA